MSKITWKWRCAGCSQVSNLEKPPNYSFEHEHCWMSAADYLNQEYFVPLIRFIQRTRVAPNERQTEYALRLVNRLREAIKDQEMRKPELKILAEELVDRYMGGPVSERHGGCGWCGGLPHSEKCLVGRVERVLNSAG